MKKIFNKTTAKILLLLFMFQFVLSTPLSSFDNNFENIEDIRNFDNIKSSGEITDAIIWTNLDSEKILTFTHNKGDQHIEWKWETGIWSHDIHDTSSPVGIEIPFTIRVSEINAIINLYSVSDGSVMSSSADNVFRELSDSSAIYDGTEELRFTNVFVYDGYLVQTSGDNWYTDVVALGGATDVSFCSTDGSNMYGTVDEFHSDDFDSNLVWHLEPIIDIDSNHWNSENVRIETYDKTSDVWIGQDIHNVILTHPEYKLKIYDLDSDELIFEDTTYQKFKYYRDVGIDSLKLVNNANEPIIFKFIGTSSINVQVNPYSSSIIKLDGYASYTIEDLYSNVLQTSIPIDSEMIYTPPSSEVCQILIFDQNSEPLPWDSFRVEVDINDDGDLNDYQLISDAVFSADRGNTIYYRVIDPSDLGVLETDSATVQKGINSLGLTVNTLYIENNWEEPIYLTGTSESYTDEKINPFTTLKLFSSSAFTGIYDLEDKYGILLVDDSTIPSDEHIIYTPAYLESCLIGIFDQNLNPLSFDDFIVSVDFDTDDGGSPGHVYIDDYLFYNERDNNYEVKIYDLDYNLLGTDTGTVQSGTNNIGFSLDVLYIKNNGQDVIYVDLTDGTPTYSDIEINPFSEKYIYDLDSYTYTISDKYNNILEIGTIDGSDLDNIINYIPTYLETCVIAYVDQYYRPLDFDTLLTEIDFGSGYIPINDQIFYCEQDLTISIRTYDLDYNLINTDSSTIQEGTNYIGIQLNMFHIKNNFEEVITFELWDGVVKDYDLDVDPYTEIIFDFIPDDYTYKIYDMYDNLLETNTIDSTVNNITYIPAYLENVMIELRDQNYEPLDFYSFKVYYNDTLITSPLFEAQRDSTVNITVRTLRNENILSDVSVVQKGNNYIGIQLDILYIRNNFNEPISVSMLENGHYQGAYSFDFDIVNVAPEGFNTYYSNGYVIVNKELEGHNKVVYVYQDDNSMELGDIDNYYTNNLGMLDALNPFYSHFEETSEILQSKIQIWNSTWSDSYDIGYIMSTDNDMWYIGQSGHYQGVYSFDFDIINTEPSNFKVYRNNGYVIVVEGDDDHEKVLYTYKEGEIYDYNILEPYQSNNFGISSFETNFYSLFTSAGVITDAKLQIWNSTWSTSVSLDIYEGKHYLGEESFTNGNFDNWIDTSGTDCYVSINLEFDGHKNVLELNDQDGSTQIVELTNIFDEQSQGIVEFWIQSESVGDLTYIYISDGSYSNGVYFRIFAGYFQDGTTNDNILIANADIWYHVKIDFDTSNWTPFINGIEYDTYSVQGNPILFDRIILRTRSSEINIVKLDAIDYSWSPGYYEGRNTHYSNYILTPIGGHYQGEISFNEDQIGLFPEGFIDSSGFQCSSTVIDELDGHKKLLELKDESSIYGSNIDYSFSSQTDGIIEYWIYSDDVSATDFFIYLNDDTSDPYRYASSIRQYASGLYIYNDGVGWILLQSIEDNTWYHIKQVFDCTTDKTDVYIDGILKQYNIEMRDNPTSFNELNLQSDFTENGFNIYLDAIDYSWSPGYYEGRNKHFNTSLDMMKEESTILKYDDGNYQGDYSFDLIDINTRDNNFFYSEEGNMYVVEEINQHSKIMMVDSTTSNSHVLYNNVNVFTTDQIDGTDDGWTNADGTGCTSSYITEKEFLNGKMIDVLQQYDTSAEQSSLTVEDLETDLPNIYSFRIGSDDYTRQCTILIKEGGNAAAYWLTNANNLIFIEPGPLYTVVKTSLVDNELYHITGVINYDDDTTDIYIDGIFIGNYDNYQDTNQIDRITFLTESSWTNNYYGWYSDIYTGDSLEEAFSTLYSNSYFGLNYDNTDLVDFKTDESIDWGTKISPNLTVFTDTSDADCTIKIGDVDRHLDTIILEDKSVDTDRCTILNNFDTQTEGIVDFYGGTSTVEYNTVVFYHLKTGSSIIISIAIFEGEIQHNTGGSYVSIQDYNINQLYHISVDFNTNTDTYNLYVDREFMGNFSFYAGSSGIDSFEVITFEFGHNYNGYLDSLSYSWDGHEQFSNIITTTNIKSEESEYIDYKVYGSLDWGTVENPDPNDEWYHFSAENSLSIIDFEGHSDVTKMNTSTYGGASHMYQFYEDVGSKTSGYVELYWYMIDVTNDMHFYLDNAIGSSFIGRIQIVVENGKFNWRSGIDSPVTDVEICDAEVNTWYHIRLEFDIVNKYNTITINGETYEGIGYWYDGSYPTQVPYFKTIAFGTGSGSYTSMYIDSLSMSWDGYEPSSNLLYDNYKGNLDSNILDFGNVVDSPFNSWDYKTGQGSTCEQWGTYGSEDFTDFTIYEGTGYDVSVANEVYGHQNVLEIYDTVSNLVTIDSEFTTQTSGIVDFWFKTSTLTSMSYFELHDGTTNCIYLRFDSGNLESYSSSTWNVLHSGIVEDQWYHVSIDFDCTTDTFDTNIDGGSVSTGDAFYNLGISIDLFRIESSFGVVDTCNFYVDGIGYDWTSYSSNDNRYIDDWLDTSGSDCDVSLVNLEDHTNVIKFDDQTATTRNEIYNYFSAQTEGSVESWIYTSDSSQITEMIVRDTSTNAIALKIDNNQWYYISSGSVWTVLDNSIAEDNTWYHVKLDFSASTNEGTFIIDGFDLGTYSVQPFTALDRLRLNTDTASLVYQSYFDSIGYSWDEYIAWSNIPSVFQEEGSIEWWQYSEQGEQILSIGDEFGIDFNWNQDFMFNPNYDTFKESQIDGTDTDWTNTDGTGCTSSYIQEQTFSGETIYNVMKQNDAGTGQVNVENDNLNNLVFSGRWVSDDTTDLGYIYFYEDSNVIGWLRIFDDNLEWRDTGYHLIDSVSDNVIIHWTCIFDADNDDIDIYINGIYDSTQNLQNPLTSSITKIRFTSDPVTTTSIYYHSDFYVGNSSIEALSSYYQSLTLTNKDQTYTLESANTQQDYEWHHYRLTWVDNQVILFKDNVDGTLTTSDFITVNMFPINFDSFKFVGSNNSITYYDAIEYSDVDSIGSYDFKNAILNHSDVFYHIDDKYYIGEGNYQETVDIGTFLDSPFNSWDYKTGTGSSCEQWGNYTDPNLSSWTNVGNDEFEVVNEKYGHLNPIHVSGDVNDILYNNIGSTQSSGYVEYWILKTTTSRVYTYIRTNWITDGPCEVGFKDNLKIDFNGATTDVDIISYTLNTWYHVKITYINDGSCTLTLDGVLISTIIGRTQDFGTFYIRDQTNNGQDYYLDGLGYSHNEYTTNDNRYVDDWLDTSGTDCSVSVVNEIDGRDDVLCLDDQSATSWIINSYFINQSTGIVEFNIRTTDALQTAVIQFRDGDGSNRLYFGINLDKFYWNDGTSDYDVGKSTLDNTWYHCKIIFDTSIGWYVEIDGISYGMFDYRGTPDIFDEIQLNTGSGSYDYYVYFSDICFSWDEGYFPGMSLLEDHSSEQYVSYEGVPDFYEYDAEYTFSDESELDSWSLTCDTSEIVSEFEGHENVFHTTESLSTSKQTIKNIVSQERGIIEFYIAEVDTLGVIQFRDSSYATKIELRIYTTNIRVYSGSGYTYTAVNYNGFPHVKIIFDCNSDTQSVWIDGVNIYTESEFYNGAVSDNIRYLYIGGYDTSSATELYFDAFDYSWSDGYFEGRNQHYQYQDFTYNPYKVLGEEGYYKGTLTFDSTDDLKDILNVEMEDTCKVYLTDEIDGHKNVVVMEDESITDNAAFQYYFNKQISGTVEWYFRTNDATYTNWMNLRSSVSGEAINLFVDADKLYYHDGTTYHNWIISDDTWYHIRLSFDCSTDLVSLWLDGVNLFTDYDFTVEKDDINSILIFTRTTDTGYKYYIDSIDFSWSSGYYEGRSLEQDYNVQPYEENFILEESQLYNYNYITNFNSEDFKLNREGIIEFGTEEYPNLVDWTISTPTDTSISIIDNYDNHENVMKLLDTTGSEYCYGSIGFDSQVSGRVELYFNWISGDLYFRMGASNNIQFRIDTSGNLQGKETIDRIIYPTLSSGQTYHLVIDFDCVSDTYDLYLDSGSAESVDFQVVATSLSNIKIQSLTSGLLEAYIDSIGLSWEGYESWSNYAHDYKVGYGIVDWGTNESSNLLDWVFGDVRYDIVSQKEGHKDPLQLIEDFGDLQFTQQQDGSVEWWWLQEDTNQDYTYLRGDSNTEFGPTVMMNNGLWATRTDVGGIVNIPGKTYLFNVWYHCKITFVHSTQKYNFYVDGDYFGEFDYRATISEGLDTFRVFSYASSPFTKTAYWDAISILDNIDDGINQFKQSSELFTLYNTEDISTLQSEITYCETPSFSETTGSIEWWSQYESGEAEVFINGTDGFIDLFYGESGIYYINNGTRYILDVTSITDTEWHHYQINFDVNDNFELYKDDIFINYGENSGDPSEFNSVIFTGINGSYFVDSIDLSWETDYIENRNQNLNLTVDYWINDLNVTKGDYKVDGTVDWGTFENEDLDDWTNYDQLSVVNEFDGHTNVLYGYNPTGSSVQSRISFTGQTSGSVEFYMGDYENGWCWAVIFNEVGQIMIQIIQTSDTNIRVYHAATSTSTTVQAGTMRHIKVDFNCSTDVQSVWINGINVIMNQPFTGSLIATTINQYGILVDTTAGIKIDGLGFSWENYESWSNLNYKLFDRTYQEDELNYLGEYSWNDESELDDWDLQCDTTEIISEYLGHENVLHVVEALGTEKRNTVSFEAQTTGIVEFYLSELADISYFNIGAGIYIRAYPTYFRFYTGAGWDGVNGYYDGFPHVKVEFDCNSDTYSAWVNGITIVSNGDFSNAVEISDINSLLIGALGTSWASDIYVDALDFSWSSGYYEGRNLHSELEYYDTNLAYQQNWETGNYQGEYSFTEDVVYSVPNGWVDTSGIECGSYIIDELDGHENVLILDDQSSTSLCASEFSIPEIELGSMEFYIRSSDVTQTQRIYGYSGSTICLFIQIKSSNLIYNELSGSEITIDSISSNTWYHIKIEFDFSSDMFDLWIDNILKVDNGTFRNLGDSFTKMYFRTDSSENNYQYYIDGFDYSWSPGYYEGRNTYEDTTIKLKEFTKFEDNSSYLYEYLFETTTGTDYKVANNVENWGTSLDYDLSDWIDTSGTGSTVSVISTLDGHDNILKLDDQSASSRVYFDYLTDQMNGIVEMFVYFEDVTQSTIIALQQVDYLNANGFSIGSGKFKYYDGVDSVDIADVVIDTWYHLKFTFDVSSTWSVDIDGIHYGEFPWRGDLTTVDRISLETSTTNLGYTFYVDGVGISWNDYIPGDNQLNSKSDTFEYHYSNTNSTELIISDYTGFSTEFNPISSSIGSLQWWGYTNESYKVFLYGENGGYEILFEEDLVSFFGSGYQYSKSTIYNLDNIWKHHRISWGNSNGLIQYYEDGTLIFTVDNDDCSNGTMYYGDPDGIDNFSFVSYNQTNLYLDAIDYYGADGYYAYRGMDLNTSQDLWCWEAYPEWESGDYLESVQLGTSDNPNLDDWSITVAGDGAYEILSTFENRDNILHLSGGSTGNYVRSNTPYSTENSDSIGTWSFWIYTDTTGYIMLQLKGIGGSGIYMHLRDGELWHRPSWTRICDVSINEWHRIIVNFDCNTQLYDVYVDNILEGSDLVFNSLMTAAQRTYYENYQSNGNIYIDSIVHSWEDYSFIDMDLLENTTTSPLSMGISELFADNIMPYTIEFYNYTIGTYLYNITDLYGFQLEYGELLSTENLINYIPPYQEGIVIAFTDQNNNVLNFDNFYVEINVGDGFIPMLTNIFYTERGTTVYYKIYDYEYNLLHSDVSIVQNGTNYVGIEILTLYLINNWNEPINITGLGLTDYQIEPYSRSYVFVYSIGSYSIEDIYGNELETGTLSGNEIVYIPPYKEGVVIAFTDQNNNVLRFEEFYIEVDVGSGFIPMLNNIFYVERGTTVYYKIYNNEFDLLHSDSSIVQEGINYIGIEISTLYLKNNWNEPINITGLGLTDYQIAPFDESYVFVYTTGSYTIEDIYGNELETDTLSGNEVVYIPPFMESCIIQIFDQDFVPKDFNSFRIYVNAGFGYYPISSQILYAERGETVGIRIYTTNYELITSDSFIVQEDENNIGVIVNILYLINNAEEPLHFCVFDSSDTDYSDELYNFTVDSYSTFETNYTIDNYLYQIVDLYDIILYNGTLSNTEKEISYNPLIFRTNFISISNQFGDYLPWENYKIKLNGTSLYSNIFERAVGTTWNISLYDRFDRYLESNIHTVEKDDNFISISFNIYSFKVYNQQELFIHVNITLDEVDPTYFWSEWIGPDEVIEFKLFSNDYKIRIIEYETSTDTTFDYHFEGDDYLLISSENTLSNVIFNIDNVNTTIGNQITQVYIDISNDNSDIYNQTVDIVLQIDNTNTSISNSLINLDTEINNVLSNITNLNTTINTQFLVIQSQINTFSTNITTILASFENNITTQISELSQSVYLVNNSIYTAIATLEQSLEIDNNQITGNLSILIGMNEYLTQIYQNTIFSNLLNWTDVYNNETYIDNQIWDITFDNEYRNQTIVYVIRHEDDRETTESIIVSPQNPVNLYIPREDIEYKITDLNGTVLQDWDDLENDVEDYHISFGYYEKEGVVSLRAISFVDYIVSIGLIVLIVVGFVFFGRDNKSKSIVRKTKSRTESKLKSPADIFKRR